MDVLWIFGPVLLLDAFLLAYLRGSGKVTNLPLLVPIGSFVAGIALVLASLLA